MPTDQHAESPITVACIQMEPRIGEKETNVARSLEKIAEAAAKGAKLIVLPELCNSGYVFASRQEAFALAEPVPDGPTTRAWLDAARQHGAVIVAGICDGRATPSTTASPSSVPTASSAPIARFISGAPRTVLRAGRSRHARCGRPCSGGWGRLSAMRMVSRDISPRRASGGRHPLVPTNWVPMPDQPANMMVMANVLAMGGAHSNSMYVAAADRVGTERDQPFLGSSLIVSHTGFPLAGPASATAEEIIYADVNLSDARRKRVLNSFNQPLRDRQSMSMTRCSAPASSAAGITSSCAPNDLDLPSNPPHSTIGKSGHRFSRTCGQAFKLRFLDFALQRREGPDCAAARGAGHSTALYGRET